MKQRVKAIFKKLPVIYPLWHGMRVKQVEIREKNKKKAFDKYAMEVLADVMKVADEKGYTCVCEAGTLLGIVRDGKLIPWDDDLDLWIVEDKDFGWNRLDQDMSTYGFWKYRSLEKNGKIILQSYKKKNVLVDISLWTIKEKPEDVLLGIFEIPGNTYKNGKSGIYRACSYHLSPMTEVRTIKVGNTDIKIPGNYEQILEELYGKNWRVPIRGFVPDKKELREEFTFTYFRKPLFAK